MSKRQPKYQWQKLQTNTPQYERDYIQSLTEGLERSESIWEMIHGLTLWLGNVAKLERARQGTPPPRILKPGDAEVAAVNQPRIHRP